jgi:hypothetical protein
MPSENKYMFIKHWLDRIGLLQRHYKQVVAENIFMNLLKIL